jgi:uncharacterized protein YlaI
MKKEKDNKDYKGETLKLKKDTIYLCHDCEKDILVRGDGEDLEIQGGKLCFYKDGNETIVIMKCDECFEKSQSLINYKECEVYSRVVGYIRPVKQWHPGKQAEFKDRKVFKL